MDAAAAVAHLVDKLRALTSFDGGGQLASYRVIRSETVLTLPLLEDVLTAPHAPWQNPYVERLIGSIFRECLDHLIVINEGHLRRVLREYFNYYHADRPHMSLDSNSPRPRQIEPPTSGRVVAIGRVGGLHHRYTRAA